jgi:hypothetical protein
MAGSVGGAARLAGAMLLLTLAIASEAHALDAFWQGRRSADWSHGIAANSSNWYSARPPGGQPLDVPDESAIFMRGTPRTSIVLSQPVTRIKIMSVFRPSNGGRSPQYTFTVLEGKQLHIGSYLFNNTAVTPRIVLRPGAQLSLLGSGVGSSGLLSGGGGKSAVIFLQDGARLSFQGNSTGGDASVSNNGGTVTFQATASARDMTIANLGKSQFPYSAIRFTGRSTGGNANIVNQNNSILDFTRTLGPAGNGRATVGRLLNLGDLYIGTRIIGVTDTFIQRHPSGAAGDLRVAIFRQEAGAIVVANRAVLGGRLEVDVIEPVPGRAYGVVFAGGGRVGMFSEVGTTNVTMPQPIVQYTPKGVVLRFNP